MGLRVEVRPSFGEQSQDLSPNRLPGGYPGLTPSLPTLSRRRFLSLVTALAAAGFKTTSVKAEDQSGVKPEAITVMVDGIPVDVSGAQTVPSAGGEEPAESTGQGGGDEILQPTELFYTTPLGRLQTEKFPEGQVGWKPREESAAGTDEFLELLNVKIKIIKNPLLRGGVGTTALWPDLNNRRGNQWYGLLNTFVNPDNPRTLIVESNITKPDLKLDPTTRELIEKQAAGAIGGGLSKIIFGMSSLELDERGTQEQRDYIGQLVAQIQDEIKPLELIAPTSS